MAEDDERGWSAPWERGHIPDQAQRDEYADLMAKLLERFLPQRNWPASKTLWVAWSMMFSREEFHDWLEGENEAYTARRDHERESKRRREKRYRQRRRQRLSTTSNASAVNKGHS
jgi:hypothetical protein